MTMIWQEGYPGLSDAGEEVEATLHSGETLTGTITRHDSFFENERAGPLFDLVLPGRFMIPFGDVSRWRLLRSLPLPVRRSGT